MSHIFRTVLTSNEKPLWLERFDFLLKRRLMPFGLFLQLTGMLWLGSSGGYITQTYIWCLLPGLLSLGIDLYRYGLSSCIKGMTTGEKLLGILFLWILVNPIFVDAGMDAGDVLNRVVKITLYLYVVRTVMLHTRKPEQLLLLSAGVATMFALGTLIYQFGILDRPMGIRILGNYDFRVGSLEIGEFAEFSNPILAALYYGAFASILCGYLVSRPFHWQRRVPAILAIGIIAIFILLSGSRGPLVAFLAMLAMAILICQYAWKRTLLVFLGLGCALFLTIFHSDLAQQIDAVVADGFNNRFTIWNVALEYICQKPWMGHGSYSEFVGPVVNGQIMRHPHNIQMNLAYNWGVPAALLFIVISGWCLITVFQYRNQVLMAITGCLLVFGQIGMLTDTYSFLARPDMQWLMFFLPVALCTAWQRTNYNSGLK